MGMKNIIIHYNYNVKLSDLDIIKDTLIIYCLTDKLWGVY